MRFLCADEESRPHFAANVREITDFCVDVERHAVRFEILLGAPGKLDVAVRGHHVGVAVPFDFVGFHADVSKRNGYIIFGMVNIFDPHLGTLGRDLNLVLLCPNEEENRN